MKNSRMKDEAIDRANRVCHHDWNAITDDLPTLSGKCLRVWKCSICAVVDYKEE